MLSPLKLKYGGIDADQSAPEVGAQNCSMDAVQKDGTQVSVSVPKGENGPAQEHGAIYRPRLPNSASKSSARLTPSAG